MNIKDLYVKFQNEFNNEQLKGEFILEDNYILWSYNLDEDTEEVKDYYEEYDEEYFNFDSVSSNELLLEEYDNDFDSIKSFLDRICEFDNWSISEPDIKGNMISAEIL